MQSESTEKLPAVEVERVGAFARVTLRSHFEEVTRDDEGTVWVWEERTCTVPYIDGLRTQIEDNMAAWEAYCDAQAEQEEAAALHAREVDEATDGLPAYQTGIDAALGELGGIAADAAAGTESAAARVEDLEQAVAELGTLVAAASV